jgi:hypothetical protein
MCDKYIFDNITGEQKMNLINGENLVSTPCQFESKTFILTASWKPEGLCKSNILPEHPQRKTSRLIKHFTHLIILR